MENKNLPENSPENFVIKGTSYDEDTYVPADDTNLPDDDLDISELLRKYLPDFVPESKSGVAVEDFSVEGDPAESGEFGEFSEVSGEDTDDSADNAHTDADDVSFEFDDLAEGEEIYTEYADADDGAAFAEDGAYAEYADDGAAFAEDGAYAEYTDDGAAFAEDGAYAEYADDGAAFAEDGAYAEYTDDGAAFAEDGAYAEYADDGAAFAEDGAYAEYADDGAGASAEEYIGDGDDYSAYAFTSDDALTDGESELTMPETDLDATDINLMVAFGLDDELARTMGTEIAAKLTEEIDTETKNIETRARNSVENEYLDHSQNEEIEAGFKRRNRHLKIKTVFGVLLSLLLLLYENIEIFGVKFDGALNPADFPVVYVMMSLQIMLLCAAVGYEQLLGGCAELFRGKISPSSVAFITNVVAVAHSVFLAETTVIPNEPRLFNSCAALLTVFAIIGDLLVNKRDRLSFSIVSTKRPKYAVRRMTAAEAGIPGGLFEDDDVSEAGILRIEKTYFVDDFFANTTRKTSSGKGFATAFVFFSLIASALVGVYMGVVADKSATVAASASFITFFTTIPVSLFVSMVYPFYKGVVNAYDRDGTILGEASAEEYADAGAVCFNDVDAFPSYGVKVQNIKIYNNHRIDRVLYYAASAFKYAGGPLSDVFEVATMEIGTSEDVEIKSATAGLLITAVDGKCIIFGTAAALRESGINLPDSVTEEDEIFTDLCPMYMIREGKLMAKLLVRYMLDSDFEFLLKALADEGMCACIKTYDPNIDDGLVVSKIGGGRYPFRVLRYADPDEVNRVCDRMPSGIVSRGATKSLLSIIGSCTRMRGMKKAGFVIGLVSAMIGALIAWVLSASGTLSTLTSLAVIVYQLLWVIPTVLVTKIFLR